jgi:hypothetical protein
LREVGGPATAECEHQHPRRSDAYRRHRPEETALYQCVTANWAAFVERMEEEGGLPRFVRDEVEQYLRCGQLEHGWLELSRKSCGH